MTKDELLTSSVNWSKARNDILNTRKAEATGTSPRGAADRLYSETLKVTAQVMHLFRHGTEYEKGWARAQIISDPEGFGFWLEQVAEYQQKDPFWDGPGTPGSGKSN